MPIYEYVSKSCGEPFEKMVSFSDALKSQKCPTCSSTDTQKKLSMVASIGGSNFSGASAASNCSPRGRFT